MNCPATCSNCKIKGQLSYDMQQLHRSSNEYVWLSNIGLSTKSIVPWYISITDEANMLPQIHKFQVRNRSCTQNENI